MPEDLVGRDVLPDGADLFQLERRWMAFPQNVFLPTDPVALLRSTNPCASFLRWGMVGRTEVVEADPEVKGRAYLAVLK